MDSAAPRRSPPLSTLAQAGLVALLVVIAAACWLVTGERMAGMDAGPGTDLGGLGWFTLVWVTMMAAMMLPSIAPMVVAHARLAGERSARRRPRLAATAIFAVGYLAAWTVAGLTGYALVEGMHGLDLGFLAWDEGGRYVAGGVIGLAALYQLTALKDVYLCRCRRPEALLAEHWRPGGCGALRMGIEHGGYCIGCCWALMAAMFALGVMSVAWMALVAALIAAEKLLPWKAVASAGVAAVTAVLGLGVAFAPDDVPGLTVPNSPGAMEAMEAMGMEGGG